MRAGGILVREGQALSSKAWVFSRVRAALFTLPLHLSVEQCNAELQACDDRLATGASLKELQLVGDRLRGLLHFGALASASSQSSKPCIAWHSQNTK